MDASQKLMLTLFCSSFISLLIIGSEGASMHNKGQPKLFVFGDSYADTGNTRISNSSSWKVPYGITFPGRPSGRFSDGHVSTDFLAKFWGLKSPIPYRWRKYAPKNSNDGMNFAFGGSGVFDTVATYPNMTIQIYFFEQLIKDNMFTPSDLQNSIALVSLAGNDYSTYLTRGGTVQGLPAFIQQVVNQLALNLQRIFNLGIKKIVVPTLQPLGCLPQFTIANQFQQCNSTFNQGVVYHNLLLQQVVAKFNNQSSDSHGAPFITLDLYNAFLSFLQQNETQQGNLTFTSPLKSCCMGVNEKYSCGSVDEFGNKLYTICEDPKSAFFWDTYHPTEAGWTAVYSALQTNLEQLQLN